MESINALAVLFGAIGGGTGIAATLTAIFQYRKYKAEADAARVANEQTEMEYIKQSFKELNEETKKQFSEFKESAKAEIKSLHEEIDKLKDSNSVLDAAVKDLNHKLSSLMSWVEGDNKRYREWLENKLQELDPSIRFPDTTDPPNVYRDDNKPENPVE